MRVLTLLPLLAIGSEAVAQDARPARPMLSDACRTEVQSLCANTGDRDARRTCMRDNRDKLSTDCKTELMAMREKMRERRGQRGGEMPAPAPSDD